VITCGLATVWPWGQKVEVIIPNYIVMELSEQVDKLFSGIMEA